MMTAVVIREARTQFRSGLTWLYLGMPALWILIVRLLPVQARSITVLVGIYSDPVMLGSLFTGAFLARERDQGLFGAWAVTPMDAGSWLAARILLIAVQGTIGGLILALGSGVKFHPGRLAAALVFASGCGALTGLFLARPFKDIMSFFVIGGISSSVITLPVVLAYFHPSWAWQLTGPSWPGWSALAGSLQDVPTAGSSYALSLFSLAVWAVLMFLLVRRMYHRGFFRRPGGRIK